MGISLPERLLRMVSRAPAQEDFSSGGVHYEVGSELNYWKSLLPALVEMIKGRRVLDYGSGEGHQAIGFCREGAGSVTGVDVSLAKVVSARALAQKVDARNVSFESALPSSAEFDVIFSQNSLEHFDDPVAVLKDMLSHLAPGGKLAITFAPLWFSPYGAHMQFFTRLPWVHLLFSEQTVLRVRASFRTDKPDAIQYSDVGLNQMSVRRFERLLANCGARVEWVHYNAVREMPFVTRIPILRELLIQSATCLLSRIS